MTFMAHLNLSPCSFMTNYSFIVFHIHSRYWERTRGERCVPHALSANLHIPCDYVVTTGTVSERSHYFRNTYLKEWGSSSTKSYSDRPCWEKSEIPI